MKKLLVIGKRGGILHWYEHVLAAATTMDDVGALGFALNQKGVGERLTRRWWELFGRDPQSELASRLAEALRRFRPDACLIVDRFYLPEQVNNLLSVTGIPVHQWVGDRFDERLAANTCVQNFWFTDSGLIELANEIGIHSCHWLPLAANTGMYVTHLSWEQRAPELLFVGAWSRNRQAQIEQLHLPMRVIGKGWHRLKSSWHEVHPYNVAQQQLVELYGRHRYVLNIINLDNIVSGLNMRCFEATAAGACLLTDDVADLPRCFRIGEEVLAWRSTADIERLLAADTGGEHGLIAQRGMARTLQDHDYRNRLQRVLQHA